MVRHKLNAARERRILQEIVVDAHDEAERTMGWFSYLDDRLQSPIHGALHHEARDFASASWRRSRRDGLAPEAECPREMFVMIRWERVVLGVPLSQLKPLAAGEVTACAIADWHYWIAMGYQF